MNNKNIFELFYKTPFNVNQQHAMCIVSHNVFWFQGAPFATDEPPPPRPEIVTQLCSLYRKIAPDVICLQELQSFATAEAVARELEMNYIFRSGGSHPQYGGAVFSHWPMEEMTLPPDNMPDRILLPVRIFPEKAPPFCLVNTHLPSSRQRGAENSQKQRLQELSLVLEQADVLLGDFNESPDGQCAALLQKEGFVDAAQACSAGATSSTISGHRGDHIWLSANKVDTLQSYFVVPKERLALRGGEKTFLSDHLPVGCWLSGLNNPVG